MVPVAGSQACHRGIVSNWDTLRLVPGTLFAANPATRAEILGLTICSGLSRFVGSVCTICAMPTTATLMDGKMVAQQILSRCAERVRHIEDKSGIKPCLATVLVGDDPASQTYTRMKRRRCESVGMRSMKVELPGSTTTEELITQITTLSGTPDVHGILLQHPVPDHIDEHAAFQAIPPVKDVDGVTIQNFGAIALALPAFGAATAAGIMSLLAAYTVRIAGQHAVVVGRSPIVGRPVAMMLLASHATVTICHSRTVALSEVVRQGDIVVAAVGRPHLIRGDWLKPGAVVVDAGYNAGNIGDVDFDSAVSRASMISPVPGGVGPMTIAILVDQTVRATEAQLGIENATIQCTSV